MLRLSPSRPHRAGVILGSVLCLVVANGCGGDGSSKSARKQVSGAAPAAQSVGNHPDPYKLTCADIVNRENYPPVYDAAVVLAKAANPRDASDQQAATRVYAAVHGLCSKHRSEAYRPARDAVAAVKRGEYKTVAVQP